MADVADAHQTVLHRGIGEQRVHDLAILVLQAFENLLDVCEHGIVDIAHNAADLDHG